MESAVKVRKVTQDVLLFVWFKHVIILEEPSPDLKFIPEITPEFLNNLRIVIWMQSIQSEFKWKGFLKKNFERITSSGELFAKYVSYACYTLNQDTTNAYASFINALSIVIYFVICCWEEGYEEFLNTSLDLFCTYFEKELLKKYEDQGGWEDFNEYLENNFDLMKYKSLIYDNIWPFDYFKQPQDERDEVRLLTCSIQFIRQETVTQSEVETNEKAVSFAESVADKMEELCQKTFDEILADFAKTDGQVEEIYQQTFGNTSGRLERAVAHVRSRKIQDEAPENTPKNKTRSEKKGLVKQIATTSDAQNSDNINFLKKVDAPNKESSHHSPKSEKARKFFGDISMDISKLSVLIQSLCAEYGVQDAVQVVTDCKVKNS